jgi:gamma-polyglutamate synthase
MLSTYLQPNNFRIALIMSKVIIRIYMSMNFLTILIIIILLAGFCENLLHQKRIQKIPIRIHVNGTRGKSTTTRLIAAILREAGYKVLAKTTGTLPRTILENGEEITIQRKGAANIIEQKYFIKKAVKRNCNAIVLECMAVHPETQWVSEHRLIKSTIGVITNVREDHQDVYGPYLENAADALKMTVPENSYLVSAEQKYISTFQEQAKKLNSQYIQVNPDKINLKDISKSENFFFKDNVALALQVGKILNIDRKICLQGIIMANPDPGALSIYKIKKNGKEIWFINAFAANDKESILLIWEKIKEILPSKINNSTKIAIVNHRDDRVSRTLQFDRILSQELTFNHVFLIGPNSQLSKRKLVHFGYPPAQITIVNKKENVEQIIDNIIGQIKLNAAVYGIGNTKGFGLKIIDYLKENGEKI